MSIDAVQNVFREVFAAPNLILNPETTAKDVDGWDSFNHINLIMALEAAFGISFTTEEITSFENVGDMINMLQEKGVPVSW